MGPAWCLLISSHAVPHPVCSHFLSSHVNRCEKMCASSMTAVLSWWCVGKCKPAPEHPLYSNTKGQSSPWCQCSHSPLQADGISLHTLPLVEPFPFQQGTVSLSFLRALACLSRSSPFCCGQNSGFSILFHWPCQIFSTFTVAVLFFCR